MAFGSPGFAEVWHQKVAQAHDVLGVIRVLQWSAHQATSTGMDSI